jgi:hypothetical protein
MVELLGYDLALGTYGAPNEKCGKKPGFEIKDVYYKTSCPTRGKKTHWQLHRA